MSLARSGSVPRDADSGSGSHHHSRPGSTEPPADPLFANLDPSLHPATLNSVSSESQNPLTSFAQHVLDDGRNELFGGLNVGGDDGSLLMGEARLDTLLEAAHKSEQERAGALEENGENGHHGEFTFETTAAANLGGAEHHENHEHEHDPQAVADAAALAATDETADQNGLRGGRGVGRGKRRREDDDGVVGPVENGEPIDPVKMKKDSHKEVERRRRENINEGINDIARLIPGGMDKIGKGQLLRRAADYIGDITSRLSTIDEELMTKEREKVEIQDQLDQANRSLEEERKRSINFESTWQQAQDQLATQQFELQRIKGELEDARKQLAEKAGE